MRKRVLTICSKVTVAVSLLLLCALPAFSQTNFKIGYLVVEGLDSLHLFQPNHQAFLDRRERVHVTSGDLLTPRSQTGYVSRSFYDQVRDFDTLFENGEMVVVNKVGFKSSQVCDHPMTRELLGRGVDRLDHPHKDGWAARLARRYQLNNGAKIWDFTSERTAMRGDIPNGFTGQQYLNVSEANNNTRQFVGTNHLDSHIREETGYSIQRFFNHNSSLARNYAAISKNLHGSLLAIRSSGDEAGGYNDLFEDPFGRLAYAFTEYPNAAQIAIARIPASFGFISGNETYGLDTQSDQRDRYGRIADNLEEGMDRLVDDLKAAGVWDRTIIIMVPNFGRSFEATGIIDEERGDNDGDARGTGCGRAGDAFVVAHPSNIVAGGFYGRGYKTYELEGDEYATPFISHTQLLHAALRGAGFDAASEIIDLEGQPCLNQLFTNGC